MVRRATRRIASTAALALIASAIVVGSSDTDASASTTPLIVIPVGVGYPDSVLVNTGDETRLSGGETRPVYTDERAGAGMDLYTVRLNVAVRPETDAAHEFRANAIRFVPTGATEGTEIRPFAWFDGVDYRPSIGEALEIDKKTTLEFAVRLPEENTDDWVLFLGETRIGSIEEMKEFVRKNQGTPE